MTGQKIIDALKEAAAGDFAAVTVDGVRWVRQDATPKPAIRGKCSEKVEEVARAICRFDHCDPDDPIGVDAHGYHQEPYAAYVPAWRWYCEAQARSAIAAMRKPTQAMLSAGHDVRNDPRTGLPTQAGLDEIYGAMIGAALK